MTPDFRAAAKILEQELSPARYRHSLAVARLAGELAKRHGWNPEKARMAGLVHDCAKEWPPRKLIAHARRRGLKVPDLAFVLETSPNLLHAYVSGDVARQRRWITDADQVRAVAAHTLGADRMGVPESILFVADLASPDRRFPEAAGVRRLARADLRQGLLAAVHTKLHYQLLKRKRIHPQPVRLWNSLLMKP